jgi:hypothetical protein
MAIAIREYSATFGARVAPGAKVGPPGCPQLVLEHSDDVNVLAVEDADAGRAALGAEAQ